MLFVLLYTCVHYFPSMFDEQFPVYSIYLNFSADFMISKCLNLIAFVIERLLSLRRIKLLGYLEKTLPNLSIMGGQFVSTALFNQQEEKHL